MIQRTDRLIRRAAIAIAQRLLPAALMCCVTSVTADTPPASESLLDRYSLCCATFRTRLPKQLREVSGLALAADQQIVLHHDNNARVWQFNVEGQHLSDNLLQSHPLKGDFEGIAAHANGWVLATSHADLFAVQPTQQTPRALAKPAFHGLCNFEGLAISVRNKRSTALLPCKYPRFQEAGFDAANPRTLYVFRHDLTPTASAGNADPADALQIDVGPILDNLRLSRIRPSAIEVSGQRLLILAGKERVVLETTLRGELLNWRRLPWYRHRQAEGLTLMPDGTLIVADEGRWLGGTVTGYAPSAARDFN